MKITKVEAIPLRLPIVTDAIDGSQDDLVIKVHTDGGLVGVGEVDAPPTVVKAIVDAPSSHAWAKGLQDSLLGEDPLEVEKLWEKMYQATIYYGRRGVVISAMSGIDIALWDLVGKALGKPVYKLLGGAFRKKLRAYASVYPFGDTPQEVTRVGKKWVAEGFTAVKFQCSPFGRNPRYDVELAKAAREAVGPDNDFMIDVCMYWKDVTHAIGVARSLKPFNVYWLEAPLPPDDIDGYAKLSDAVDIRIAGGDLNFTTRYEFQELLDRGKVDVVQPDVTHSGGISELRKIAQMADLRGKEFAPHSYKTGIAIAATMHLVASTRNGNFLEFSVNQSILRKSLTKQSFWIDKEGYVEVPEEPGLGVDIDDELLQKYRS